MNFDIHIQTFPTPRRAFIDALDPRASTVALVASIRDVYARAVFVRLLGGTIARNLAAAYHP
jgi:hypothetical protein